MNLYKLILNNKISRIEKDSIIQIDDKEYIKDSIFLYDDYNKTYLQVYYHDNEFKVYDKYNTLPKDRLLTIEYSINLINKLKNNSRG